MNEIRENAITGRSILYAPARGSRPRDQSAGETGGEPTPRRDPDCPFCPGNEERLLGIHLEVAAPGDPGWQTRVVPNRYPALGTGDASSWTDAGPHRTRRITGRQEVVVESPRHDLEFVDLDAAAVDRVIETYRRRWSELGRAEPDHQIVLFRNAGRRAGASLRHPHAQLVALSEMTPSAVAWTNRARSFREASGDCLHCRMLEWEEGSGERIIEADDDFVVLVPYAAEMPFESWIVPRTHAADFAATDDAAADTLARLLSATVRRVRSATGVGAWNLVIHAAPRSAADDPALHWWLRIYPRTSRRAGLEIGTGIDLNPSLPEDDARSLREAAAEGRPT